MSATIDYTLQERIADFLERYGHTLDDGRVDDWSAFFDENATYQVTTRENVEANMPLGIVLCIGRRMLNDRIKALKEANIFESHTHRHVLGRPLITLREDGTYGVRSSFVVYRIMYTGKTEIFATGVYDDVIAAGGGPTRFLRRLVVLDSRAIDTLMVYPL
jgi:anthranilate 1,2-dioxygenase small subunit